MVKVYITKYALSSGIFSVHGELFANDGAVSYRREGGRFIEHAHGKDFHLTAEEALARAEEMRISKLKSLEKKIKNLSEMKFQIKD